MSERQSVDPRYKVRLHGPTPEREQLVKDAAEQIEERLRRQRESAEASIRERRELECVLGAG